MANEPAQPTLEQQVLALQIWKEEAQRQLDSHQQSLEEIAKILQPKHGSNPYRKET